MSHRRRSRCHEHYSFLFVRRERAHRVFSSGAMLFCRRKNFSLAVCGLKFEWSSNGEKENKKDCSLSLSLFIEKGNSVCLSALSQGSLCPLLRANTRIFAREERERGRERERRRRKSERERRESERERERFILLLLCVGVVSGFFDQRKREKKKKKKKKKKVYRIERGRVNENKYNVFLSAQSG